MQSILLWLGTFLVEAALKDLPDKDKLGLRIVGLLIFLLERVAAQTTNTVDDELVGLVKKHLEQANESTSREHHE